MWMGFILFRQMNRSCGSYQVLRISLHVKVCNVTGYVYPQSTEKLT